MEAVAAKEAMLGLLAEYTDGKAIRRGWLEVLMKRFDAQLGACQNAAYDSEGGTLRYSDNVSVGPEAWMALDQAMDGVPLPDVGEVEHLVALDRMSLYTRETMPPQLIEMIWEPFGLQSSVSSNVTDDGHFVGHISIFRTGDAPVQFDGSEMTGANRDWQTASFKLMSATHAMLVKGPRQRAAMLFKPDGTPWMQTAFDASWADSAYHKELANQVEVFAKGDSDEGSVHTLNTRIRFTRLEGGGERGILVVAEPMCVPKVNEIMKLSPMERLVASHFARGGTIDEVAAEMSRSPSTIKSHLEKIYERLGIGGRAELAVMYESSMNWAP